MNESGPPPGAAGFALVVADAGELGVLLAAERPYYPVAPPPPEAAPGLYRAAD